MTTSQFHPSSQQMGEQIRALLRGFPHISLAILFGSVAAGCARVESDLDLAVAAKSPLTSDEKIAIISRLAVEFGRPVDLVDLNVATEPLLGQILRYGRRLMGNDLRYGELLSRHLFAQTDFMPYRSRILAERREAWINKSSSKS